MRFAVFSDMEPIYPYLYTSLHCVVCKNRSDFNRSRWEDNIKMDLQEVGYEVMDWIKLAQDTERRRAVVNAVMNLRVPIKFGEFLD